MEKELSVYKAKYKALNDGLLTKNSLEITVYGEDLEQLEYRLHETKIDLEVNPNLAFKLIEIERK